MKKVDDEDLISSGIDNSVAFAYIRHDCGAPANLAKSISSREQRPTLPGRIDVYTRARSDVVSDAATSKCHADRETSTTIQLAGSTQTAAVADAIDNQP